MNSKVLTSAQAFSTAKISMVEALSLYKWLRASFPACIFVNDETSNWWTLRRSLRSLTTPLAIQALQTWFFRKQKLHVKIINIFLVSSAEPTNMLGNHLAIKKPNWMLLIITLKASISKGNKGWSKETSAMKYIKSKHFRCYLYGEMKPQTIPHS